MAKWRGTYRTAQCGHIAWPVHCFRQWDEPSGDGRSAKLGCAPRFSELDEKPLAFDAVELLGFPVDALFDHFETVGGGLTQNPLRATGTRRRRHQ